MADDLKITKEYISTGALEKQLKKYYLESDASKKMIDDVIQDIQQQADNLLTENLANLMFPKITKTIDTQR